MGRDPAGLVDGPNLYAFVGNRPTYTYDPWGLFAYQENFVVADWNLIRGETGGDLGITKREILRSLKAGDWHWDENTRTYGLQLEGEYVIRVTAYVPIAKEYLPVPVMDIDPITGALGDLKLNIPNSAPPTIASKFVITEQGSADILKHESRHVELFRILARPLANHEARLRTLRVHIPQGTPPLNAAKAINDLKRLYATYEDMLEKEYALAWRTYSALKRRLYRKEALYAWDAPAKTLTFLGSGPWKNIGVPYWDPSPGQGTQPAIFHFPLINVP